MALIGVGGSDFIGYDRLSRIIACLHAQRPCQGGGAGAIAFLDGRPRHEADDAVRQR